MQGTIFQSAQRIIAQVLEWLQSTTNTSITERVSDTFQNGVCANDLNSMAIVGKDIDSTLLDFFHVEVQTGIAYISGERTALLDSPLLTYNAANPLNTTFDGVSQNVPTPQSTGSYNILLTAGFINYVFIGYLATVDTTQFTLNDITLAKQFYKQTDGYQILVNTTGINPNTAVYILLGQVNLSGTNQAVSSNISIVARPYYVTLLDRVGIQTNNSGRTDRPTTYAIGSNNYFLDDHIKSIGTGTVSPFNAHGISLIDLGVNPNDTVEFHREHEHVRGIIAGTAANPDPIASAFFAQRVQVTPGDDFIIVQALGANEVAVLNGIAYTSAQFGVNFIIPFTGNPAGVYNIYFDGTTFGITQTNITDDVTKLWLATTTWTPTSGDGNLSTPADRRQFGTLDLLQRWVTAGRPQDPQAGNFGYNFDSNILEYYNGSSWQQPISNLALNFSLTNILDNGGFEIWQRGTSFVNPVPNTLTADRWRISSIGSPSFTISRNSSIVDNGQYSLEWNTTSVGSGTFLTVVQAIENYLSYAGKTITLSIRMNSNVAGANVVLYDGVTTGGISNTHTGDGTWQTLTTTFTVSNAPLFLEAFIFSSVSEVPVVSTIYVDSAMLILGNTVTSYIPLNPEEDLARCQRYYQTGIINATIPFYATPSVDISDLNVPFVTTMRVAPTVTLQQSSGSITVGQLPGLGVSNSSNPATFLAANISTSGFIYNVSISHQTSFQVHLMANSWTASADI